MTQRMCAKEYMDQEMRFTAMINDTHFIKKEDKQLILLDADKKEVGRLVPEKAKACN